MHHFDLVIVGTGSGNMIPGPDFDTWDIAIVERGVFGGTCLNVGCIPSKMLVYAADVAETVRHAGTYGVDAMLEGADWPAIVKRVFGRIDPISAGGERYRVEDCPNITVLRGHGRFVGHKVLEVGEERITADHIVLGAGARPFIPALPGLSDVPYHTSDTVMRVDELPERLVVLGGGYIAAELGHVFEALGAHVTVVTRGDRLLRAEDDDVSDSFTRVMARRFDLCAESRVAGVGQDGDTLWVDVVSAGQARRLEADVLLVATGRIANGDLLDVDVTGVRHDHGRVIVDAAQRTNVEGIWAFGDIANDLQLKHLANLEARTVAHNLLHPTDLRFVDASLTPHAIFSHPQVAAVGLTEREAHLAGIPHVAVLKPYGSTAYGWAMEDEDSFVKLVVHAETRQVIGAHLLGPQASTLVQQLIQGMAFGLTADQMAQGMMYIHPALSEVVENALLDAVAALDR